MIKQINPIILNFLFWSFASLLLIINFLEIKNNDGKQTIDTNGNFKAQYDEHAPFPKQDNPNIKSEVC